MSPDLWSENEEDMLQVSGEIMWHCWAGEFRWEEGWPESRL